MKNQNGLTIIETERLEELEEIITKNFQGFYEVGRALAEINYSKLYRVTHKTFEDYCRERFEVARRTAYQYIEAKDVMDNVRNCAQFKQLPANEAQVRPLTKLAPELQLQAWEKVVEFAPLNGGITAKHVSHVVGDILGDIIEEHAKKLQQKTNNSPVISEKFKDAIWALIEVVRDEVSKPIKPKTRQIMIEGIQGIERLLAE